MQLQQIDPETGEIIANIANLDTWRRPIVGLSPSEEMVGRASLALKLSKAYEAVEAVLHDDRNTEHKYSFASAETIYRTVRKGLSEVGLAVIPLMGDYVEIPILKKDNSGERRGAYMVLDFDFCLIDGSTGYTIIIPWRGEVMEYGDKAFNKAATNATKYMLRTLFLLPTDREEDSDKTTEIDRPSRNNRTENSPAAPAAPAERQDQPSEEEIAKRAMAKESNEKMKSLGLDQDKEALKTFSTLAKEKGLHPLATFLQIAKADEKIQTWDGFTSALSRMIANPAAGKSDTSPSTSGSPSESGGSQSKIEGSTKQESAQEPDPFGENSSESEKLKPKRVGSKSYDVSSPEFAKLLQGVEEHPDKSLLYARIEEKGTTLEKIALEALSLSPKSDIVALFEILHNLEGTK